MTDTEIRKAICGDICTQFLEQRARTPRKLLRKYRRTQLIRDLCDFNCIEGNSGIPEDKQSYAPELRAFVLAGNHDHLKLIRTGMVIIIKSLQCILDEGYDSSKGCSPEEVFARARQIDDSVDTRGLELGLYYRPSFLGGVGMDPDRTAVTNVHINDAILDEDAEQWVEQAFAQSNPPDFDRSRFQPIATASAFQEGNGAIAPDIDWIIDNATDATTKAIAGEVRDSIVKGSPQDQLDRLHTLMVKVLRAIANRYGITWDNTKAIHAVMGEYVNRLRKNGGLKTQMTSTILRSITKILDDFGDVRNNWSRAHDNPEVDPDEALVICTFVCAAIRFILEREQKLTLPNEAFGSPELREQPAAAVTVEAE